MLFAFVPMACIAAAFYYLNKADPDCGTNFTWGVRAFGPKAGWIAGWGCIVADLVIMPNLAGVSGQYLVLLLLPYMAEAVVRALTEGGRHRLVAAAAATLATGAFTALLLAFRSVRNARRRRRPA